MFYYITFQGYFIPQDWGWHTISKLLIDTGIQVVTSHTFLPLLK